MSKMSSPKSLGILLALIVTAFASYQFAMWQVSSKGDSADTAEAETKKPMYWVAPMDPNYRRDEPGKSPMGMDLVPVYAESDEHSNIGTVKISPEVVNNMGVRTALVSWGMLQKSIRTVGYVQYDEDRLIHIHPRVEGWIEELYLKAAGDPVAEGDPLYALYSPTLVSAQEELLLAVKRNNQTLINAAVERLSSLQVQSGEIDRIKRAGKVSQTVTVYAPQSGVVDNLLVREGMFVKPGMEIMAIGQLAHIWVIGEVFEREVSSVQVGAAVQITLDYLPGKTWSGTVDYIYPTLNPVTRTTQIRVRVDNPDSALKPGMFAQLDISVPTSDRVLLVPRDALIRLGDRNRVVLALGAGRFKSIEVTVGSFGDGFVEVLAGLEDGDRVVTSAQFLIDSESSKTSDFRRMGMPLEEGSHGTQSHDHSMNHDAHKPMNHSMDSMNDDAHKAMNHSMDSMSNDAHKSMGHSMSAQPDGVHEAMNHDGHSVEVTADSSKLDSPGATNHEAVRSIMNDSSTMNHEVHQSASHADDVMDHSLHNSQSHADGEEGAP